MKDKDSLVTILLVAGGGLALYWYLTNYGPNGAVSAGGVSWWQSWFGGTTTTAPAPTTTTTATQPTQTIVQTNIPPAAPAAPPASVFGGSLNLNGQDNGVLGVAVILASKDPTYAAQGNLFTGSQWNYYVNKAANGQLTMPAIPGDNGQPMSFAAYAALLQAANLIPANSLVPISISGVSGIVPVPWKQTAVNINGLGEMPQSMSFGKGFGNAFSRRRAATPPMGPMAPGVN